MANELEEINLKEIVNKKTSEYQLQKLDKMKKKLPQYIKDRQKAFAKDLSEYINNGDEDEEQFINVKETIPLFKITENVFKPIIKVAGAYTPQYSSDEVALIFDFYVKCTDKLNETYIYIPKIQDFCRLLNISVNQFRNYQKSSSDENMRTICDKVQDYCVAKTADGALYGSIEKYYAVFHQKSSNQQRDNDPVQNNILIQSNNIISDEQLRELERKFAQDY